MKSPRRGSRVAKRVRAPEQRGVHYQNREKLGHTLKCLVKYNMIDHKGRSPILTPWIHQMHLDYMDFYFCLFPGIFLPYLTK